MTFDVKACGARIRELRMREMIGWIRTTSDICGIVLLWLIPLQ